LNIKLQIPAPFKAKMMAPIPEIALEIIAILLIDLNLYFLDKIALKTIESELNTTHKLTTLSVSVIRGKLKYDEMNGAIVNNTK
jgi:hypothetical protein